MFAEFACRSVVFMFLGDGINRVRQNVKYQKFINIRKYCNFLAIINRFYQTNYGELLDQCIFKICFKKIKIEF